MSRVILLAGLDAADTADFAAATAEAVEATGMSVRVLHAGDASRIPATGIATMVGATLGAVGAEIGADPLIPEAWAGLPSVRILTVLDEIRRTRQEGHVTVVDVGSLSDLRDLLNVPQVLQRVLDASLTPRTAMRRSGAGEAELFDVLSEARLQVLGMTGVLASAQTSVRLVGRPTMAGIELLASGAGEVLLSGVQVDGIVLHPFSRKQDGAAKRDRRSAQRALRALRVLVPGMPVWRSGRRVRPVPAGCVVTDVLPAESRPAAGGRPIPDGQGFTWDLTLPDPIRDVCRVGVQGGSLVVEYSGIRRWLELPSVLQRCVPVEGHRTAAGIRLIWAPDQDVWPAERPGAGERDE